MSEKTWGYIVLAAGAAILIYVLWKRRQPKVATLDKKFVDNVQSGQSLSMGEATPHLLREASVAGGLMFNETPGFPRLTQI
jgi:hypothetical protein